MRNERRFRWGGHEFIERLNASGRRMVILRLQDPEEEFSMWSETFLREDAAVALLQNETVQEKIRARIDAKRAERMTAAAGK